MHSIYRTILLKLSCKDHWSKWFGFDLTMNGKLTAWDIKDYKQKKMTPISQFKHCQCPGLENYKRYLGHIYGRKSHSF